MQAKCDFVSEPKCYNADGSRTVQRHREIIYTLKHHDTDADSRLRLPRKTRTKVPHEDDVTSEVSRQIASARDAREKSVLIEAIRAQSEAGESQRESFVTSSGQAEPETIVLPQSREKDEEETRFILFVYILCVKCLHSGFIFLMERSVSKSEQADVVIRIPPNSVASFTEKPLSRGQSDLPMTPARKSDTEDSISLLPTPLTSARGRSAMGLYTILFLALSEA